MAITTWRYWRMNVISIIEPMKTLPGLEFLKVTTTQGGATVLTGGTPSANSEYEAGTSADKAFVDDTTYWAGATSSIPGWIQYDMGPGNSATGRYLEFRGYSPDVGFSPKQISLMGSNDASTWTTLLAVTLANYSLASRFVVAPHTIRIPFGYIVGGNSTHLDTTATQRVVILDWTTGEWIDTATPNVSGDWTSTLVPSSDVLTVSIGDSGYVPSADGPVTPALR